MKSFGKIAIASLCLLMAGGCITDCSCGFTSYKQGRAVRKYYVPPKTTVSVDADGHVDVDTTPEEWRVVFLVNEERSADLNLPRYEYESISYGDQLPLGERYGRWTRFRYSTFIARGAVLDSELSVER